jgi:hypothetical protein
MKVFPEVFVFCFLVLTSCSKIKDPTFEKITDLAVKEVSINKVVLKAEAKYFNPNAIGGEIKYTDIKVNVNNVDLGSIAQTFTSEIKGKSDFSIPIIIEFSPKEIFKSDGGFLKGILNAALNKNVDVKYQGHAVIEIMDVDIKIPIEHEEVVHLKK